MEYVYGKMVQLGASGFLMGGGLVAFTLVDDYIRFRIVPGGKPGQIDVAGVSETTASTATHSPLLKNKPLGAAIRGSQHASTGTASLSVASLNTRLFKDWFFRTPPENSVRTPSWWWLRQAFDNRPPWQRIGLLAAAEGLRTAKIVTLASGAAGMIGVALYGRDGDKIYSPVHNRAGFAVGAAIGAVATPVVRVCKLIKDATAEGKLAPTGVPTVHARAAKLDDQAVHMLVGTQWDTVRWERCLLTRSATMG